MLIFFLVSLCLGDLPPSELSRLGNNRLSDDGDSENHESPHEFFRKKFEKTSLGQLPRPGNNQLNEDSENRENSRLIEDSSTRLYDSQSSNRLFDSQNGGGLPRTDEFSMALKVATCRELTDCGSCTTRADCLWMTGADNDSYCFDPEKSNSWGREDVVVRKASGKRFGSSDLCGTSDNNRGPATSLSPVYQDCVGRWSTCSSSCKRTWTVVTPTAGNGAICFPDGYQETCNTDECTANTDFGLPTYDATCEWSKGMRCTGHSLFAEERGVPFGTRFKVVAGEWCDELSHGACCTCTPLQKSGTSNDEIFFKCEVTADSEIVFPKRDMGKEKPYSRKRDCAEPTRKLENHAFALSVMTFGAFALLV